jgi:uncharacterized GH25 family protein
MRLFLPLGSVLAHLALPLNAHEFWVEPLSYTVSVGEEIALDLRVGQTLEGQSYPYLSHKFARYQVTDADGVHDLLGIEGDIPSVLYDATVPGLHVIAYHARPEQLTYESFEDFNDFVDEEGLNSVVNRHRERRLPETGFTEAYTRNAKALVQVGPALEYDTDLATGMDFELVALRNPYLPGASLPVKLLWQGAQVSDAQVAVFQRDGNKVVRSTYRTNDQGIADIPLHAKGIYLLSSVHMEESAEDSGAVWQSTWASLTFAIVNEIVE